MENDQADITTTVEPEQDVESIEPVIENPNESQQAPVENNTGGQGELIQGLRQPINIEIHGN